MSPSEFIAKVQARARAAEIVAAHRLAGKCRKPKSHAGREGCCDEVSVSWWAGSGTRWFQGDIWYYKA